MSKKLPRIYINSRCRVEFDSPDCYAGIRLQYRVKFWRFSIWKTVNEQFQNLICYPTDSPDVDRMVNTIKDEGQQYKSLKLRRREIIKQAADAAKKSRINNN